jgi:HAD superfamily hydrolase (TIGR01662 family)
MIKAVIFDLDGTLLDSIDAFWRAFNNGVAVFQLPPVPRERLMECMDRGDRMPKMMGVLYPDFKVEEGSPLLTSIMVEIRKGFPNDDSEKMGLMSGARELLHLLKQRGLKMAVVTSRSMPVERLANELRDLEIDHFMDAMVTSADSKRKPAPDTVIKCLQTLDVAPGECLMIGDSRVDVIAGKAAGVKTVAVTTGVAPSAALAAESPDFIFDSLLSLVRQLDSILGEY